MLMERKIGIRAVSLALVFFFVLSGCKGDPTEEIIREFSLEDAERRGETHSTVEEDIQSNGADEPSARVETVTEESPFFLEMGSGFALSALSDAEKIWYRDMEQILGSFGTEIYLSEEGLKAGLNEDSIDRIFQCVLNDHPELFYVDGYSYTKYSSYGNNDEILSVEFSGRYNVDIDTARSRHDQIKEAVSGILEGIDSEASQYDKVKYVYDTLIRETDYQLDSPDNQNIYSVFVNHLSVCQGYAKATQYLLNRLGVECALVLGTVETGEGHAWNLVNIDGSYYYVDTTWGDASYQLEDEEAQIQSNLPEINYDYLNVTTAELLRTHTLDGSMLMPQCIDTKANYYVREGALFSDYDREQMAALFERMQEQGRSDVTVKCTARDVYDRIFSALIEKQEIFNFLTDTGGSTVAYTQNETQLSLTFWVTNG